MKKSKTAKKTTTKRKHKKSQLADSVWENAKQIFIAVVLALIIKTSVVEAYKIPTSSMEDTLLVGDFLLANKFVYGARLPIVSWQVPSIDDPERGDIIIFIYPRDGVTKYIKRCVGLSGDTIEVKDKVLYVNGEIFSDPEFSKYTDRDENGNQHILSRRPGGDHSRDNFGPVVVPSDHFFMMGDNRDNSSDSRFWGYVPRENILGEAMVVHWSWNEEEHPSPEVSVSDPLSVIRLFVHNIIHFHQKVRWERLFGPIS